MGLILFPCGLAGGTVCKTFRYARPYHGSFYGLEGAAKKALISTGL